MARYAKLLASIWQDADFRARTAAAQRVYMLLISQPNISHCGILPVAIKRWANLAPDTSVDHVEAALVELVAHRFIVIDDQTDELWVRSWIRHDGLMFIHNGAKAVARSIDSVLSTSLATAIRSAMTEITKPLVTPPDGRGCQAPTEGASEPGTELQQQYPSPTPTTAASPQGVERDSATFPDLPTAAAAALAMYIDHRMATDPNIGMAGPYRKSLELKLPLEHGNALRRAASTLTDPHAIAFSVFGLGSAPTSDRVGPNDYVPLPEVPPLTREQRDALVAQGRAEARHLRAVEGETA